MNLLGRAIALVGAAGSWAAFAGTPPAAAGALTRADLLAGCTIPVQREFPLSQKIRPCDDFYGYVCSEVAAKFTLPADRSIWGFAFADADERILCAKKQFFKRIEKGYTPVAVPAKQTKNYYLACMDEKDGAAEERALVKAETSTILALKTPVELAFLAQSRLDAPKASYLGFQSYADQDNPARGDVILSAEMMTLPEPSYYQKPEVVQALHDLALAFFQTVGADRAAARAQWVVDFEKGLAKDYPTPATLRQRIASNTYIPRSDWQQRYPHLQLQRFLGRLPADVRTRDLIPESMAYFEHALTTMPLDELKSVYLFHAASGYMDDAYPAYFAKSFAFRHKYFGGPEQRPDRQERCTKETMHRFSMEVDEELVPILFPDFPVERVTNLAGQIRSSIDKGLDKNTWLSPPAKAEARRKIATAKMFLVKPANEAEWNFHYPAVYDPAHPYANRELWQTRDVAKSLDELAKPRPQDRWSMGPLALNAYYSPPDNKFVLLQGILQYPFFSEAMTDRQNLGAIGAVVGHELGHGIDDAGSRYDADGKLKQWMTMDDMARFAQRTTPLVDRFNKIGHNGKLTLGENIGDYVGLSFAYAAAFPPDGAGTKEDKQAFFAAYARLWCQVVRPEFAEYLMKVDPHSRGYARTNEQVVEQAGFYDAYSCNEKDKMFVPPEARVNLW